MKSSEMVVLVDSVESAVKFYTEKLGFDIVKLSIKKEDAGLQPSLSYARVKKGKCFLNFRLPDISELAEFSFIKRGSSRSTGLYILMKKGLEKYFARCKKKGVPIIYEPKQEPWGVKSFTIKDPFGIKLTFIEPIEGYQPKKEPNFYGLPLNPADIKKDNVDLIDDMVLRLKEFGILRRAAKKFAKLWIKNYLSK